MLSDLSAKLSAKGFILVQIVALGLGQPVFDLPLLKAEY